MWYISFLINLWGAHLRVLRVLFFAMCVKWQRMGWGGGEAIFLCVVQRLMVILALFVPVGFKGLIYFISAWECCAAPVNWSSRKCSGSLPFQGKLLIIYNSNNLSLKRVIPSNGKDRPWGPLSCLEVAVGPQGYKVVEYITYRYRDLKEDRDGAHLISSVKIFQTFGQILIVWIYNDTEWLTGKLKKYLFYRELKKIELTC